MAQLPEGTHPAMGNRRAGDLPAGRKRVHQVPPTHDRQAKGHLARPGRHRPVWQDRGHHISQRPGVSEDAYNYEMVRGGHAHCYMLSGGEQARYRAAEHQAQEAKQGLWKRRNPEPPWDYRARQNRRKTHTLRLKLTLALLAAAAAILLLLARACDSLAG